MNVERDPTADRLGVAVARIRSDSERIADAVEHGPLDAPVPSCPGWDLRELVVHTGMVHRRARFAVINARPPEPDELELPVDDEDLAAWIRPGAEALADQLLATDPDAETWHPFPVERTVAVWGRRQAQETAMHRWDAENAVFGSSTRRSAGRPRRCCSC